MLVLGQKRKSFLKRFGAGMLTTFFIAQWILLGLMLSPIPTVSAVEFTPYQDLSAPDPGDVLQNFPDIAVENNGIIHVVWEDWRNGDADIFYRKSNDFGTTWDPFINVIIDPTSSDQIFPKVAVDSSGVVHIIWQDYRNTMEDIYYATSADGFTSNSMVNVNVAGASEVTPGITIDSSDNLHFSYVRVPHHPPPENTRLIYRKYDGSWSSESVVSDTTAYINPSDIVVSNDNIIHMVWSDLRASKPEIYYDRSTDGGSTWGTDIKLNDDASYGYDITPSIVTDSNNAIHVIWETNMPTGDDVIYDYSIDGENWQPDKHIGGLGNNIWGLAPDLAIDSNDRLHVVYSCYDSTPLQTPPGQPPNPTDLYLYYILSTNYGSTWRSDVPITDSLYTPYPRPHYPSIATGPGGIACVAWRDQRMEDHNYGDIYFARTTGCWIKSHNLVVEGLPFGSNPDIALDSSDNIHVVWSEERGGDADIYHSVSYDYGQTWMGREKINKDVGTASQIDPSMKIEEGVIYVVWSDNRNGDWDIYFSKSSNGGVTWTPNERVNDDAIGNGKDQLSPDIDISTHDSSPILVHVVWQDERYGQFEIFYCKWASDTGSWIANVKLSDMMPPGNNLERDPAIEEAGYEVLVVVWKDFRNGNFDIYSKTSLTAGYSWQDDQKVSNDPGTGDQLNPKIDYNNFIIPYAPHVVWEDNRYGVWDIFHAKNYYGWIEEGMIPNPTNIDRHDPDVVCDETGYPDAVWYEYQESSPQKILHSSWDGSSWSSPAQVSDITNPDAADVKPSVCVNMDRDEIYVVWITNRNQYPFYSWEEWSRSDIYFDWSTVSSITFSIDLIVSWLPSQEKPSVAIVSKDHFKVVWQDLREGNWDIFITDVCVDSYGQPGPISLNTRIEPSDSGYDDQKEPAIAFDSNGITHVVWSDNRDGDWDIYYSYFMGGLWITEEIRDSVWDLTEPDIAVHIDGGYTIIDVVWTENIGGIDKEVCHGRKILGQPGFNVNYICPDPTNQESPAIVVDSGGTVHAVWSDNRNGDYDIHYGTYDGIFWNIMGSIWNSPYDQLDPDIALNDLDNLQVVWSEETAITDSDIWHAFIYMGSWIGLLVDDSITRQENPTVAVHSNGRPYIVWSDNRDGNWDIYHRHEITLGKWAPVERVNDDTGTWDQIYPVVVFDDFNREFVVWQDARNSINLANEDVYFSSCFR